MSKFIDVTMRLIDDFTSPLNRAVDNMQRNAKKAINAGKQIQAAGDNIASVGDTITKGITLPLIASGTAMVKTAANFEEEMSKVQAIANASADEFATLKDLALELGANTAFSAKEVAQGMTEMAKAGWTTNDIVDGMAGVLDAAAASGESLATTSTIVADALTGFGMATKESTRVADLLTQAANAGTIDISDLGETFKYISPVANAMKFNIEDVTTAVSAMSLAGIKGSQAGTSLRTTLVNLVRPTDKIEAAMEKLGIEIANSDGSFKTLYDIVGSLRNGFDGLTDKQKSYYASILAGKEGMSGLLSILNLTEEEYYKISEEMYNAGGVAEQTADIMRDNLNSSLEELGGSFETLSIKLGDLLIPKVREYVDKITEVINKISALDDSTQNMILNVSFVVAAIGPMVLIFGKVVSAIGMVVNAIGAIGTAVSSGGGIAAVFTGPVGIIIAALAAVVAGGVLVYKNWDKVKEMGAAAWGYIRNILDNCGVDFGALKDKAIALGGKFVDTFMNIKDNALMMWDFISPVFYQIGGTFVTILPSLIGGFVGFFASIVDSILNIGDFLLGGFDAIVDFIANVFCGKWKDAFNSITDFMRNFGSLIVEIVKTPVNAIIGMINGIFETINNLGVTFPDWFPGDLAGKTFGFSLPTIPKLYTGTDYWQGGPAMVHDKGAEIIDLPQGSRVYPHDTSLEMARAQGAASAGANINISDITDSIRRSIDGLRYQPFEPSDIVDPIIRLSNKINMPNIDMSIVGDSVMDAIQTLKFNDFDTSNIVNSIDNIMIPSVDMSKVTDTIKYGLNNIMIPSMDIPTVAIPGDNVGNIKTNNIDVSKLYADRNYKSDATSNNKIDMRTIANKLDKLSNGGAGANINIAKLSDSIVVREDADIDKIATALVDKLQRVAENIGGVTIGNMA